MPLLLGRNDLLTFGRCGGVLACFRFCGVLLLLRLGLCKLRFVEEVLDFPVQGCNLELNVLGEQSGLLGGQQLVLLCQRLILPQLNIMGKKLFSNNARLVGAAWSLLT